MSTVATVADLGDTLKRVYAPRMTNLARLKSKGATLIPQSSEGLSRLDDGMEVRPRIQLTAGSLSGSRGEGENYPDGNAANYVQAVVRLAKHTTKYAFTPEQERASLADAAAWESIAERYARETADDAGRDFAAQLYGAGNGVRAVCGTTTDSDTVVLATATTQAELRTLRRGMKVDIGTVASPTAVAEARVIESIDTGNKTITISGANVTTDSTHRVFLSGSGGATAWGPREIFSLQQIAGSGDLYGISVSSNPEFVGYQNSNSGTPRALTATLAQKLRDEVRIGGGNEPTHGLCSPGVYRSAVAQEAGKVRYTMDNQNDLEADIEGISIGGFTLVPDDYVWEGQMFLTSFGEEGIQCPSSGDYQPVNPSVTFETNPSGSDARIYRAYKFHQLVATQRNSIGHVKDLTEA